VTEQVEEQVPVEPWITDLCHELRSAITVVGGNAELILLRNPELKELVEPIITASDRLEAIVKRLAG
jgi:nitrogen-specific signal transduction histidine kinase